MNNYEKYIKDLQKKFDSLIPNDYKNLQKELQKYSAIIDSISNISKVFSNSYFDNLSNRIAELTKPITDFFNSLPKTLQNYYNFKEWANYGWGIIDYVPKENTYFKIVGNSADADAIMEYELSDKIISDVIQDIKKTDLATAAFEEAIECFYNAKYTACILILFSIIDAYSINLQEINDKKRKLANPFSKELLEKSEINELTLVAYLRIYMPLQAITVLFANGGNFRDEPNLPNRNYISHGMNKRQVTKIDCVKVLSIISNLADLRDFINLEELLKNET